MRFRKKPVVVEAVQWDGRLDRLARFMGGAVTVRLSGEALIPTPEGTLTAQRGDWVIRGVNGEYYPCKPDVFQNTYEEVSDDGR